jgi:hypothetical protein
MLVSLGLRREWQYRVVIPPRTAIESHLVAMGKTIDIVFHIDLGQLVRGHHIIARGISLGEPTSVYKWQDDLDRGASARSLPPGPQRDWTIVATREPEATLHYEFIPGLDKSEHAGDHFFWYWKLHCSDDVRTAYSDANTGARAPSEGGPATHATRDIGGSIPATASRLMMDFAPARGWTPPEPCRGQLVIDLTTRSVADFA